MSFRSRVLGRAAGLLPRHEHRTDLARSPEVGWTKVCESERFVNAIAPDLSARAIFAVFAGGNKPRTRSSRLTRLANGAWNAKPISDAAFAPQLTVSAVTRSSWIPHYPRRRARWFTSQPIRASIAGIMARPSRALRALGVIPPPALPGLDLRRRPGVPNVVVTELQVHQNFRRAIAAVSCAPRRRARPVRTEPRRTAVATTPVTLTVQAIQIGEDGALRR